MDNETGDLVKGKNENGQFPIDFANEDCTILLKAEEFKEGNIFCFKYVYSVCSKKR
jgi:hypothetical protein